MSQNELGMAQSNDVDDTSELLSPTEKIEGKTPTLPGVENPESEEIKKEVNPNTE
ncbi:MAG: hypothetical protein LC802_08920 [Acidobacteria bacterium]|nr:hypothetical protein [Acidobacteriota bacterium]